LNEDNIVVKVDLMNEKGVKLTTAHVVVPLAALPKIIADGLYQPAKMDVSQKTSLHGLEIDVSTTRGEAESEYFAGEEIQFLLRVNRHSYVYLFDLNAKGEAVLLFPGLDKGEKQKQVVGNEVLILPDDGMPYKIVVTEPYGKDLIWAVASEQALDIPGELTGDWGDAQKLKKRIHQMAKSTGKGFAEAFVLVTTSEN
jgi:hypothetical protein